MQAEAELLPTLRHQVRAVAREWAADAEAAADVELVISELASNVVRHAAGPYTVTMAIAGPDGELLVEVADSFPGMPGVAAASEGDCSEAGRGLQIVAACAGAWGCRAVGSGKAVWAHFPAPVGAAAPLDPPDPEGWKEPRIVSASARQEGNGSGGRNGADGAGVPAPRRRMRDLVAAVRAALHGPVSPEPFGPPALQVVVSDPLAGGAHTT
ncbi:ATP-binding protein [Streptomyces sp. NBC_00322]|uniref:ATP-binding protein n=1 Tax=Streptomyces sp. NBC_00322 TaxID=2975712 RepID=UPI002E29333D|nr:ATP-binding protein [Streptomyces sp. NBC_00322]